LAQTTVCDIGRRCHVAGKNLTRFGSAFTRAAISELASSSVLLIDNSPVDPQRPMASGTLIADTVVLCAAHSLQTSSVKDIRVLLFHEAGAATAPAGNRGQYPRDNPSAWRAGTSLRSKPQGKVVQVLEQGDPLGLDYALLAIEWTELAADPGGNFVEVPRFPVSKPGSRIFSREVVLIGHPIEVVGHPPPQVMSDVETAQASAGIVTNQLGPNPQTNQGSSYSYAGFAGEFGMSGGGVFNASGNIIGVLKGFNPGLGVCFLNLGEAANALPQSRLAQWLDQGNVFKQGDPHQPVTFNRVPA
jgi:hypothetical protein